jgi:hypothetical protein
MDGVIVYRLVESEHDEPGWGFSAQVPIEFEFPPLPKVIESKYALLKMCDLKRTIQGVGKRKTETVFYVHLSEDEYDQLKLELEGRYEGR